MKGNRFAVVAAAIAILLVFTGVFSIAKAQDPDASVVNYVFTEEAVQYTGEEPIMVIGQEVNIRMVPSTDVSKSLDVLEPGDIVQKMYVAGDWTLVRVYSSRGIYKLSGWVNNKAAGFKSISDTTGPSVQLGPIDCQLTTGGAQHYVNVRLNAGWYIDPASTDCNLICEGTNLAMDDVHNLWSLRDVKSGTQETGDLTWVENEALLENGVFTDISMGTCWAYPKHWNMSDSAHRRFDCSKEDAPPIACALAGDKFGVMAAQTPPYAWDVHVHRMDGDVIVLPYGSLEPADVNRCDFSSPRFMDVTGSLDVDNGVFVSTSIGALECRSLVLWQLPDRTFEVFSFEGPLERLSYFRSYAAYLLPSTWTENQVYEQILAVITEAQKNGFLTGEVIMRGVPGFEDGTVLPITGGVIGATEAATDAPETDNETETDSD